MNSLINNVHGSLRAVVVTMAVCCVGYFALIWAFANLLVPGKAEGSLIVTDHGRIVGSELIAQEFSQPKYFWPRPSAVDYNASGAGGSNLSSANPLICERAEEIVSALAINAPVPADLVTASGGGLDPHITLAAAIAQVPRVAAARGHPQEALEQRVRDEARSVSGLSDEDRLINVLLLNLALDAEASR